MTRTRLACMGGAAAVARIYNHGIDDGIATFQNEPRTVADIEHMLSQRGDTFPTIVVERDEEIVALAGAGVYRAARWYAPILEHSVYVDRSHRGTGAARIALLALIDEAERLGFLNLVRRIFVENEASRALHRGARSARSASTAAMASSTAPGMCVIVERLLGEAAE